MAIRSNILTYISYLFTFEKIICKLIQLVLASDGGIAIYRFLSLARFSKDTL
jgi:hypothetical protein